MDLLTSLTVLDQRPAVIIGEVAMLRGAAGPLAIPLACLPPAQQAAWLLARPEAPLHRRVGAALAAGLDEQAWTLVIQAAEPIGHDRRLALVLDAWSARELARLALPPGRDAVLVVAADDAGRQRIDDAIALGAVREMLAFLPWPRWSGPLLAVVGDAGARDPAPGRQRLVRPALPLLRVRAQEGTTPSEALAAGLAELVLDLTAPPAAGWPAWLRLGLMEVAKAKTRGEGPSPAAMLELRQQAGRAALARLLGDPRPDPALAMALCAPLVHSRRRHLLPNLLDLLRGGAGGEGAIRIAYGLTLDQLASER